MSHTVVGWIIFNLFVLGLLALDLGVFHRKVHVVKMREAVYWSIGWIILALLFNVGVYIVSGPQKGLEFLTAYIIERSLSIDNIFVFLLIFNYFNVDPKYQHKVLFWGILGALILRAAFIITGVALIESFEWMVYVFGGLLILTGIKMGFQKNVEIHPDRNPVLRLASSILPMSRHNVEGRFFIRENGRLLATPLLLVILFVETTDVVFAVDSIPAILAISRDSFIVYTSNVFAILGLRALYFAVAGMMELFHHLHYGLSTILVFVGIKMLISHTNFEISTAVSLGVIAVILVLSVVASLIWPKKVAENKKTERISRD